jgi:hypothetical protein
VAGELCEVRVQTVEAMHVSLTLSQPVEVLSQRLDFERGVALHREGVRMLQAHPSLGSPDCRAFPLRFPFCLSLCKDSGLAPLLTPRASPVASLG